MHDERTEAVDAVQACYPDKCVLTSAYSGYINLSVLLDSPLPLILEDEQEQHVVIHLPSIRIAFTLPNGYPETVSPVVILTSKYSWLSVDTAKEMEDVAASFWENHGRISILGAHVSEMDDQIKTAFGLTKLHVNRELLTQLLEFNRNARKTQFDKGTYECAVIHLVTR